MQTVWVRDCKSEDERIKFTELFESSSLILDKLSKILYNRINSGESVKTIDYDSPSWSHKQADLNGYLRAHKEIIDLLKNADHA